MMSLPLSLFIQSIVMRNQEEDFELEEQKKFVYPPFKDEIFPSSKSFKVIDSVFLSNFVKCEISLNK